MSSKVHKHHRRLHRQVDALKRGVPGSGLFVDAMMQDRMRLVRLPLGVLLVLGSGLAILPVFGLWMLPAGLILLAVDIPLLRPRVSAAIIRGRRKIAIWRRRRT
jgi:hypothetical protein